MTVMITKAEACAFALLISAGCSLTSMADYFTWNERGDRGWADPASYVENKVPNENDVVNIPDGKTALVYDSDMDTVKKLKAVVFGSRTSKIVFDVSEDHEITCSIAGGEDTSKTNDERAGVIEKIGTGMLWLKNDTSLFQYCAEIVVNDGILRLPTVTHSNRNQTYRKLVVNKPGILYTVTNNESPLNVVHFRGPLYGDGLVTNPTPGKVQYYPIWNSPNNIPVFSGKFGGRISISAPDANCYQDFTGSGSVNEEDFKIPYRASFGLTDLGGCNGDEIHYGSFGCGNIVFSGSGTLRYLGTGGISYARFEDDNAMKVAHIDAGAAGGLRLLGRFALDQSTNVLKRLVLSGENVNECTIEGSMYNRHSGAVYLTKKGSGTWSLASETAFSNGVIAVENGTLRFTSIRNKGVRCSLGGATILRSEHTGAIEESVPLPYAYLLGTPTTTGTMEYIGRNDAVSDDRAFAIKGSGRVVASSGALVLSGGVGSVNAGENIFTLGGNAAKCVMNNVTNGVGTIKVVKEGSGDWTLGGELDFTGGIEVKAGCLTIGHVYQPGNYSFYRLTIREKNAGGSGNSYFTIGRLALFNEAGEVQNIGLEYNPAANSNGGRLLLEPGQFAYSFTNGKRDPNLIFNDRVKENEVYEYKDNPMYNATNIFSALDANVNAFARFRHSGREGTSYWPAITEEEDWPSIDFRLPAGSDKVARYDIGARYRKPIAGSSKGTTNNWKDVIGSWTLYGSVDGENWTELSSVTSNDLRGVMTTDCSWLSDGSSYATAAGWENHTSGWAIKGRPDGSAASVFHQFTNGIDKVSVDAGATLCANGSFTINSLKLGENNGCINGFAFSENGTIEFTGSTDAKSFDLNVAFVNCTGLDNLKKWKVEYAGKIIHVVGVNATGIQVAPYSLRVLVR